MIIKIIFVIIGFVFLSKGADFLVDGSSEIAKKFHIPEIVIGLTIVAIGTSMPELVVSVTSSIEGHSDIAIGNIVGSNIANLFFILGMCAIIKPLQFKKETRIFEIPFTIFTTIVFFIMCTNCNGSSLTKLEGIILLLLCGLFILYNLFVAKNSEKFEKFDKIIEFKINKEDEKNSLDSCIKVAFGIFCLKFGGDLVVDNCVIIAKMLGVTERLISLTIVAFSTSLPELITSISATKKNETDIAIGNIIGSQIFNILLIIGLSAIFSPLLYSHTFDSNIILLIVGTFLLWIFPYIGKENGNIRNKMTRFNGILFVLIYIYYLMQITFLV